MDQPTAQRQKRDKSVLVTKVLLTYPAGELVAYLSITFAPSIKGVPELQK